MFPVDDTEDFPTERTPSPMDFSLNDLQVPAGTQRLGKSLYAF